MTGYHKTLKEEETWIEKPRILNTNCVNERVQQQYMFADRHNISTM